MAEYIKLPEWTKEMPTKPGLYFYREADSFGAVCMCVEVTFLAPERQAVAWGIGVEDGEYVDSMMGEWQGPLEVETLPEGAHLAVMMPPRVREPFSIDSEDCI